MSRSTFRTFSVAKLNTDKTLSSVILRLMMSLNNISLTMHTYGEWNVDVAPKKKRRQVGAKLYFARIMTSHVYEALAIIEDIDRSQVLNSRILQCDTTTIASFQKVKTFLRTDDYKALFWLRNKAAFHYDGKMAARALDDIVKKEGDLVASYSLGRDVIDWYFPLGDQIIDRIIVREALKIKTLIETRKQIDEIEHRCNLMATAFADFASNFIRLNVK